VGYTYTVFTVITTDIYDRWFAKLRDAEARARILARLKRIEMGNLGDVKPTQGAVSEVRIDYGPGYRLYFTRRGIEVIVLLVGGDKSSQQRDIRRAVALAAQLKE
jgi:putative addiction module killer protein